MKNKKENKGTIWQKIDMHILIPGALCLLLIVVLGAVIPREFVAGAAECAGLDHESLQVGLRSVCADGHGAVPVCRVQQMGQHPLRRKRRKAQPENQHLVHAFSDRNHRGGHLLLRCVWPGQPVHEPTGISGCRGRHGPRP